MSFSFNLKSTESAGSNHLNHSTRNDSSFRNDGKTSQDNSTFLPVNTSFSKTKDPLTSKKGTSLEQTQNTTSQSFFLPDKDSGEKDAQAPSFSLRNTGNAIDTRDDPRAAIHDFSSSKSPVPGPALPRPSSSNQDSGEKGVLPSSFSRNQDKDSDARDDARTTRALTTNDFQLSKGSGPASARSLLSDQSTSRVSLEITQLAEKNIKKMERIYEKLAEYTTRLDEAQENILEITADALLVQNPIILSAYDISDKYKYLTYKFRPPVPRFNDDNVEKK